MKKNLHFLHFWLFLSLFAVFSNSFASLIMHNAEMVGHTVTTSPGILSAGMKASELTKRDQPFAIETLAYVPVYNSCYLCNTQVVSSHRVFFANETRQPQRYHVNFELYVWDVREKNAIFGYDWIVQPSGFVSWFAQPFLNVQPERKGTLPIKARTVLSGALSKMGEYNSAMHVS